MTTDGSLDTTTTPTAAPPKTPDSLVDAIVDVLTARAAQALVATKSGLEASARWLDGRAKIVGDLATKLRDSSKTKLEAGPLEAAPAK